LRITFLGQSLLSSAGNFLANIKEKMTTEPLEKPPVMEIPKKIFSDKILILLNF